MLRKAMSISKKMINIILVLCFSGCLSSCSKEYRSRNEADYEIYVNEVYDAINFMPQLNELGDYESVVITRKSPNDPFFSTTNSIALIVQYDIENFNHYCEKILQQYTFYGLEGKYVQDIEASTNNFQFNIIDNDNYITFDGLLSAKQFLLLGINQKERKVAYLYHWDASLDYIKNLDEFIEKKYVLID